MDFFDFLILLLILIFPILQQVLEKNKKKKRGAGTVPPKVQSPADGIQASPEQLQLQDALREIRAALGVPTRATKPQQTKPAGPSPHPIPSGTQTAISRPSLIRSHQPSTPKQSLLPPRPTNRLQKPGRPQKKGPAPPKKEIAPALETPLRVSKPSSSDILASLVNNLKDTQHTRDAILLSEILGPPRSLKPWR